MSLQTMRGKRKSVEKPDSKVEVSVSEGQFQLLAEAVQKATAAQQYANTVFRTVLAGTDLKGDHTLAGMNVDGFKLILVPQKES